MTLHDRLTRARFEIAYRKREYLQRKADVFEWVVALCRLHAPAPIPKYKSGGMEIRKDAEGNMELVKPSHHIPHVIDGCLMNVPCTNTK